MNNLVRNIVAKLTATQLRRIIALIVAILFVLMLVAYCFRFKMWRDYPRARWFTRVCLRCDPMLRHAKKERVRRWLGEPLTKEGRYCVYWFPKNWNLPLSLETNVIPNIGADLMFKVGDDNRITHVYFVYGQYKPSRSVPINLDRWKDHTDEMKTLMNADLVKRWSNGEFRDLLKAPHDILRYFNGAAFVDYWQYPSDAGDGIGGSLDFEFDPEARVQRIRFGYID